MDLSANHILVVFLLTTLAGLATGIGGFIAFFMKRTDTKTLTFSLGFSGGVMVYISLVELLGEAQHRLMEFEGHTAGAWIAIASFFGGIAVAALIDCSRWPSASTTFRKGSPPSPPGWTP